MEVSLVQVGWISVVIIGGYWSLASLLIRKTMRQLDERFVLQDKARKESQDLFTAQLTKQETSRKESQAHWESRFKEIEDLARGTDKSLLIMRGDMPHQYVRREDYIRGQTIIESKLDAIASELKMVQIRGGKS